MAEHKQDRKQSIIHAARDSFSRFGYKGTTMDQVAHIAQVGKGTIYTFFKNKEELFQSILQELMLEMKSEAENAIDPHRSLFDNLHETLYRILAFRREHHLLIQLSQEVKSFGTPAAKQALNQIEIMVIDYIERQLTSAIEKEKVKPCDPKLTAFIMFKMYIALIFDWEQKHGSLTKQEIYDLYELYLLNGIASAQAE